MTWHKIVKTNWPTSIILIAASLILSIGLERIPFGFFCDEAIIGFIADQVVHGNFSNLVTPLFYRHFEYVFGAGPIYATLPFVWIFGLNIL